MTSLSLIETNIINNNENEQSSNELNVSSSDFNMINNSNNNNNTSMSSNPIETSVIALSNNTSFIQTISCYNNDSGVGDENMLPIIDQKKTTSTPPSFNKDACNVKVAIRIRPQTINEKVEMSKICTSVAPNQPQVTLGHKDDKTFTFDYVYDIETTQQKIFDESIRYLIDGCFDGYNATVLAYGQTGSGKTYTMGTSFDKSLSSKEDGIIPRAIDYLFERMDQIKFKLLADGCRKELLPEFSVFAQFLELYNEEINDLFSNLSNNPNNNEFINNTGVREDETNNFMFNNCNNYLISNNVFNKAKLEIHEDQYGNINVQGLTNIRISSANEALEILKSGAKIRTTGATNQNTKSSRSHAIFSILLNQKKYTKIEKTVTPDSDESMIIDSDNKTITNETEEFEILSAKFHFVDLAGSERLKRTGATGHRAKEGIYINRGLLALGNVISALGDRDRKSANSHVPYRDSKLTRLLQDSLGGNSKTIMIACISPSDRDFMETLNTLRYANRAKNIKNKIFVNHDKTFEQISILKSEIQKLNYELMQYKALCNSNKLYINNNVSSSNEEIKPACLNDSSNSNNTNNADYINSLLIIINNLKNENNILTNENTYLKNKLNEDEIGSKENKIIISNSNMKRNNLVPDVIKNVNTSNVNNNNNGTKKSSNMNVNQLDYEKQLNKLQNETFDLKKLKVKLMNQLKHEAIKSKQTEQKRIREIALLKKSNLKKDTQIKILESEKRCRDIILKRKQEELQTLRRLSTRLSDKASGRISMENGGRISKISNGSSVPSARSNNSSNMSNSIDAKNLALFNKKWLKIDESIQVITLKKQTIGFIEKEMEQYLDQRDKISRKLNKLKLQQEKISSKITADLDATLTFESQLLQIKEKIGTATSNIDYIQRQIEQCQTSIIQLDEVKDGFALGLMNLIEPISSVKEAQFFLKKSLNLALDKGVLAAQNQYLNNQLEYELEKIEKDYIMQQKLIQNIIEHSSTSNNNALIQELLNPSMITSQTDFEPITNQDNFEIDEIILAPRLDDSSDSDCDEILYEKIIDEDNDNNEEEKTPLIHPKDENSSKDINIMTTNSPQPSVKTRQLTTNGPEQLLFKEQHSVTTNTSENTIIHNNDNNLINQAKRICSVSYTKIPSIYDNPVVIDKENLQQKISSPTIRNKQKFSMNSSKQKLSNKKSENQQPEYHMSKSALYYTSNESMISKTQSHRHNITESSSPPKNNVFNRLTSINNLVQQQPQKGIIKEYKGNTAMYRISPISLTHIAEGHSKSVLSCDSYDLKLFTSSKDRTAKVWDLNTCQELCSFNDHINNVTKIKYCSKTQLCYTVSSFYIKLWDMRSPKKCIKTLNSSGLRDDTGLKYSINSGKNAAQNRIPFGEKVINDFELSQDGDVLYVACDKMINLWDIRGSHKMIGKFPNCHNGTITTMLADEANGLITGSKDHYIKIFDFETKLSMDESYTNALISLRQELQPPHYDGVQSLYLLRDSLFSCSRDMSIKKWNMNDFQCTKLISNAHNSWICALDCLEMFNNLDILISGCREGYLKFWNVNSVERLASFKAHQGQINSIKVNKMLGLVFTGSDDATVKIWKRTDFD